MKSAEMLLVQYETKAIKTFLREAPLEIRQRKEDLRSMYEGLQNAEQGLKLAEADLMTDISAETDPETGKAVFSNEKARAAELTRRKAHDPTYLEAQKEQRAAKADYEGAKDELDEIVDKYRSYRVIAELTTAELRLLAGFEPGGEVGNGSGGSVGISAQEVAAARDREEGY
ncbi:MAG: hypothetical protein FH749_06970 [Firmicutes bacterium]|nr:hypothetical protein [Bacillota bacterium]